MTEAEKIYHEKVYCLAKCIVDNKDKSPNDLRKIINAIFYYDTIEFFKNMYLGSDDDADQYKRDNPTIFDDEYGE